jgi:hypothetical protein
MATDMGLGQAERGREPGFGYGRSAVTGAASRLRRLHPEAPCLVLLVAIILAANIVYLGGITDPNPLGPRSQIATDQPGLVSGANTLDPTDGYITQALGHLAAEDVLHGHLPLWNPDEGVGMPLLGEGQSAALFPPTLLLALDDGQFWEDLLLELLAGVGTYLVVRALGARRAAAVAAGAAFAVNGAFAWLTTTAFNPVAFLPFLVLGLEQAHAAAAARRRGGWWLIAVALALSIYAGFPETTYIDGLVAVLWFLWRCGCAGRRSIGRFVLKALAGAVGGLLIAAPFLVAFAGALPHEFVGFHNGNAAAITMPRFAFPQLWLPYVYGPPLAFTDPHGLLGAVWGYAGGFVPISLVLVGAMALLTPDRRGLKLVLWAWVLLALAKVYGQPPVLRAVLADLPGGSSVAFYRYSFPAVSFALAVLSALAIDQVSALGRRRLRVGAVTVALLALTGLLAYEAHRLVVQISGDSAHSAWAWTQLGWAAGVVALVSGAVLLPLRRIGALALTGVMILDACAMFAVHELSAPRSVRVDTAPVSYLQRHLGEQRFFTLGPIAPNYAGYWGLASLNDIDLPLPKSWTRYINARLDPVVNPVFFVGNTGGGRSAAALTPEQELLDHVAGYRAAGVSYVVTPPSEPLPARHGEFRLVLRSQAASVYRLSASAPFYSPTPMCSTRAPALDSVRISCSKPAILLRRELSFPGWSAGVDGRPAVIARSGIFQSLRVPAGTHEVTFSYWPPYFTWALIGLLVGLVWVVVGAWLPV